MGRLLNKTHWVSVANNIGRYRPMPNKPMPHTDAIHILSIACRSLTELANDKDLTNDIKFAKDLAKKNDLKDFDFLGFIEEFERAEREILLQSGVEMDIAEEILRAVIDLGRDAEKIKSAEESFHRLDEKIAYCAKLSCAAVDGAKQQETSDLAKDMKGVITGVVVIALDAAGAAAAGATANPALAMAFGVSAGLGGSYTYDFLKKRW